MSAKTRLMLEQLKNLQPAELTKSKPNKLWINGVPYDVKHWKDVSLNFVRALLAQNILRKEDLPFYPNSNSAKAYINSDACQPINSFNGLFKKAADGFYVDIKYNAKYHILNIWRSLEKLNLQDKWHLEFEIFF